MLVYPLTAEPGMPVKLVSAAVLRSWLRSLLAGTAVPVERHQRSEDGRPAHWTDGGQRSCAETATTGHGMRLSAEQRPRLIRLIETCR